MQGLSCALKKKKRPLMKNSDFFLSGWIFEK